MVPDLIRMAMELCMKRKNCKKGIRSGANNQSFDNINKWSLTSSLLVLVNWTSFSTIGRGYKTQKSWSTVGETRSFGRFLFYVMMSWVRGNGSAELCIMWGPHHKLRSISSVHCGYPVTQLKRPGSYYYRPAHMAHLPYSWGV